MGHKKKQSNLMAVFRLKPLNRTNTAEIKYVGTCKETDKLGDEIIEIKTDDNMIEKYGKFVDHVCTINGYDVVACVYKCNIMGSYMLQSTRLPVYNVQIIYKRTLVTGVLMSIYVLFNMTEESKKSLKTPGSYINARVEGNYTIELDGDDGLEDRIREETYKTIEKNVMESIITNDLSDDNMEHYAEEIDRTLTAKINQCERLLNSIKLPVFPNENIIVSNYLQDIYRNDYFKYIIASALTLREDSRRRDMKAQEEEYEIPTNVININQVKENPNFVEEYVARN